MDFNFMDFNEDFNAKFTILRFLEKVQLLHAGG